MQLKRPCTAPQTHTSRCTIRIGAQQSTQSLPARLATAVQQAATAVALTASLLTATPACAITTEQLLFLEAWRAVDRAYVDKTFNNNNWFKVWLETVCEMGFVCLHDHNMGNTHCSTGA